MYRIVKVEVKVADDSNLNNLEASRTVVCYETRDNESCIKTVRVGPSDSEAAVDISPVTTGYFYHISSDYPVKVRLNGASETQTVMVSNNVAATNVGGPLPDQSIKLATETVTSIRLAPISSATQTANVHIIVTGDPTNSHV